MKNIMITIVAAFLVGCGGGGSKNNVRTIELTENTYLIPDDVRVLKKDINGTVKTMITSGANESVAGFVQSLNNNAAYKITNIEAMQKNTDGIPQRIKDDTETIKNISLLSSQAFQTPYLYTVTHYNLETQEVIKPLDLAAKIHNIISGDSVEGLSIIAHKNAVGARNFRLSLLHGNNKGEEFYVAAVVSETTYNTYESTVSNIINGARVSVKGGNLRKETSKFEGVSGSGKADFLFVIDNSGSMSDNQNALAQAADDFSSEIQNSGLKYRSAIITTDSGANDIAGNAYNILNEIGIIEDNIKLLKRRLVAGTGGSATETGIWNAEQSLQSKVYNNNEDGAVTLMGMPKDTQTILSVIIISDEVSQYTSRSENGDKFNVDKNLFLDRNIKVYSIIDTSDNSKSQYDNLSTKTGGLYSDIGNINSTTGKLDFSIIMKKIAQDAGGAASSFVLNHFAASINNIKINGKSIKQSNNNGWTYIQSSRSIIFHGTSLPKSGDTISISYNYYE